MGSVIVNPVVLANKGVPVRLNVLDGDVVKTDANGDPITEELWLRFDAWTVAQLERQWDGTEMPDSETGTLQRKNGLDAWGTALQVWPNETVIRTLAIVFDREPRTIGKAMIAEGAHEYGAAISAAYSMAQGMDPKAATRVLVEGLRAAEKAMAEATASMLHDETDETEDGTTGTSPGTPGGTPGSVPSDETPTSSGD